MAGKKTVDTTHHHQQKNKMYGDDDHLPYITYGIFGITILYLLHKSCQTKIPHLSRKSGVATDPADASSVSKSSWMKTEV